MSIPAPPAASDEGAGWKRVGQRYSCPLLVRQYPSEVPFGFLGRVAPPSSRVDVVLEAERIPTGRALELVHGARAVADAELLDGRAGRTTPELEVERRSADELGRAVASRAQELWRVGLAWVGHGPSRARAESERQRLAERLAALGFRTRVPRYQVAECLAAPGHGPELARPSGYWQTLTTDGLAALYPFGDETVLEPGGALVGLSLADASPVFLDRWAHASHSWGMFGTTGAGKSFAAALTVLRSRWLRDDLELIVLDPLGEYGSFVRRLGGTVVRLRDHELGRLNPLDPVTTAGDRREKAARVVTMLRALWPSLADEEAASLDAAVRRLYDRRDVDPTFGALADELRRGEGGRLPTLLEVFRTGSLRELDGPTTLKLDRPVVAIDLAGVPDEQLPFHLAYLLDWTYHRVSSRPGPKLVVLDEAHLLARHAGTAEFLDRTVRHLRHFRAGLLLLSQNPDDFLGSPAGRSLLRNLSATALLRLPEVSDACRAFFGLSGTEAEWLAKARLPADAGYAESLWRVGPWHLPLAIVASTPEFELIGSALGEEPTSRTGEPTAPRSGGL